MTEKEWDAYRQGFIDGLTCFAWNHPDGHLEVGTTGTTLKRAKEMFDLGILWNQEEKPEDLK